MKAFSLLAVDDNPDNLFLLEQLVQEYLPDCAITTASCAREGLNRVGCELFDGAIVDVQMPEMDGIEMCRRLKANPQTARLPVLLISAKHSTPQLRSEGLEAGADDFISRPIDNVELVSKIRVMLRIKQTERQLSDARNELETRIEARTTDLAKANTLLRAEVQERSRAEDALRVALEESNQRAAENAALLTGVRAILEEQDFHRAAEAIFLACKRLVGAQAGYIALQRPDGDYYDIVFLDAGGLSCEVDPDLPMPIRGLRAEAYASGRVVYDNSFAQSRHAELMPPGHAPLDNVLFAPLILKGLVVGLLGLGNKPGGFSPQDARMAAAFGEFASIALQNSRARLSLEDNERELTARNRIAEAFLTVGGDEIYSAVLKIVLEAMQSKHGVFGYLDENGALIAPTLTSEVWDECRTEGKAFVFPPEQWGESIWGRALRTGQMLCLNQPFHVPEGHIAMRRCVSAPIVYQGHAIGLINVANKETDYDDRDRKLLQTITMHVAPVLHTRLTRDRHERQRREAEEALREAHRELENRVRERTAELLTTNDRLQREIGERKRAEAALRETNALLERVFATTQISLAYLDTSFNFIRANRAYGESDNRPPDWFVGKNHFELFPNRENETIFRQVLATGEPCSFYGKPFTCAQNPERGLTYWDWSLHPVKNGDGQVEGLLLCLVDVTKRERAEAEARLHQAELAHVSRLSTMGEMGSAIAHELNQPLCAILSAAQACLRLVKNPRSNEAAVTDGIEQVVAQARRAAEIIRHLREFSRKRPAHRSTIQLNKVVQDATALVTTEARPHGVRISLQLGADLPLVLGDTIQIEQVLVNLMRNAIEAMEGCNSDRRIDVRTFVNQDGSVRAEIRDNGRGLPNNDREKIFEAFFSTKPEGMGIGLAISRSIIEAHGGRLWAVPAPDRGAVFQFVLPANDSGRTVNSHPA